MSDPRLDPKLIAGIKLLERTGMREFRLGWSDEEDGDPVVWYACATWGMSPQGIPLSKGGRASYEAAAAIDPVSAVLRLCERVIDGGACMRCGLPTLFIEDSNTDLLDRMGCVYAWDPELQVFRRGCEGD